MLTNFYSKLNKNFLSIFVYFFSIYNFECAKKTGSHQRVKFEFSKDDKYIEGDTNISIYKVENIIGSQEEIKKYKENHFFVRESEVKMLVLHFTSENFNDTLNIFGSLDNVVASHFVIAEEDPSVNLEGGEIYCLASPEKTMVRHAGISQWVDKEGKQVGDSKATNSSFPSSINHCSIGIENINLTGYEERKERESKKNVKEKASKDEEKCIKKWLPFDKKQINSLGLLCKQLVEQYNISPLCVVAHSDIAPDRKIDPGILFPWETLYKEFNVGAWLDDNERDPIEMQKKFGIEYPYNITHNNKVEVMSFLLSKIGYDVMMTDNHKDEKFTNALHAFQMHFSRNQQSEFYRTELSEEDLIWAYCLACKYKRI